MEQIYRYPIRAFYMKDGKRFQNVNYKIFQGCKFKQLLLLRIELFLIQLLTDAVELIVG